MELRDGLLVFGGGALGAMTRFWIAHSLSRWSARFPWGTLAINLSGSFLMGIWTGLAMSHTGLLLWAVGFTGAYTTFSTFTYDTVTLWSRGQTLAAWTNVAVSLIGGVALVATGIRLGEVWR